MSAGMKGGEAWGGRRREKRGGALLVRNLGGRRSLRLSESGISRKGVSCGGGDEKLKKKREETSYCLRGEKKEKKKGSSKEV